MKLLVAGNLALPENGRKNLRTVLNPLFAGIRFIVSTTIMPGILVYGEEPRRAASAACEDPLTRTLRNALEEVAGGSSKVKEDNLHWLPDVTTTEGRVRLLMSILEHHPGFVTKNLSFKRNVLETLGHIPEVVKLLKEEAASLEIHPPEVLSMKYSSKKITYNQEALSSFKSKRIEDLKLFQKEFSLREGDLGSQLKHLKTIDKDRRSIRAFVALTPFLYDGNGKARFAKWDEAVIKAIEEQIGRLTHGDIENIYGDFLKEHINPLVEKLKKEKGSEYIAKLYLSKRMSFLDKEVKEALRTKEEGPTEVREISIETVPAAVAVARGCYGGDCSILSVPFFALHRDVQVHFIRKSKDLTKDPDGYILTVDVEANTSQGAKTVRYVLTPNGATLTQADVEAATHLALQSNAHYRETQEVVFPDWTKENEPLVNFASARQALTHKESKKITVKLPQGWEELDQYHAEKNGTNFKNYYAKSRIERAKLGKFTPSIHRIGEIEKSPSKTLSYEKPKKTEEISALQRAVVANQALENNTSSAHAQKIFEILKVNQDQVRAAKPLIEVSKTKGLILTEYRDLEKHFQFGLKDILNFEEKTRAKILDSLYTEAPSLMTEHRARENGKVKDTLAKYYGGDRYQHIVKKLWEEKGLPDVFAIKVIKQARVSFNSMKMSDTTRILNVLKESSSKEVTEKLLPWLETELVHNIKNVYTDMALGRELFKITAKGPKALGSFESRIFNELAGIPIIEAYRGILREMRNGRPQEVIIQKWLTRVDVSPKLKAEFLKSHMGYREKDFLMSKLITLVPENQYQDVWKHIEEGTNIELYRKLAEKLGLDESVLFDHGKIESFQFKPIVTREQAKNGGVKFTMGEEGNAHEVTLTKQYEMMAAPLTQFLKTVLSGENGSHFTNKGYEIKIKGKKVKLDPNRPAEHLSWEDEDVLLGILSDLDPNYNYRKPTEAEWEYAARAGTTTKFSYGDSEEDMVFHGWTRENSGSETHPVAELRANAYGLHDMSGNVWEWTHDRHGEYPRESVVDPTGPSVGSIRVIRGGGWDYDVVYARSALRNFYPPHQYRNWNVGARFVRTPR